MKNRAPISWTFSNVIAGSDSVGSLMRTTVFNLLSHPRTLDKLYNELLTAGVSRPYPRYSELRNLPYLDACVQEGIRMHPPFALPFERIVPKGGVTVLGHFLPEGTAVGGSPYVVNRHKGTFGDDAEFWRPERWLEKDDAHKKKLESSMLTVSRLLRRTPPPPFPTISRTQWCSLATLPLRRRSLSQISHQIY